MNPFGPLLHVLFWYGLPLLAVTLVVALSVDGIRWVFRRIDRGRPKHWAPATRGIFVGTLIALGVGSIPLLDGDGPSLDADWLRGLALVAILLVPAALAFVGLRRPGALLAAGIISVPMCLMSFSFLLFPLLIPAVLYFVAYDRAEPTYNPRLPAPITGSLTFVFIVLAFMSLFVNEDPHCYEIVMGSDGSRFERPVPASVSGYSSDSGSAVVGSGGPGVVGGGCSSDSVTPFEAGLSLTLTAIAGISATYLSGPRRRPPASLDVYA